LLAHRTGDVYYGIDSSEPMFTQRHVRATRHVEIDVRE
jgi:hypothetical protein